MQQPELQELIPLPGDRVKFKANWALWKQELESASIAADVNQVYIVSISAVTLTVQSFTYIFRLFYI